MQKFGKEIQTGHQVVQPPPPSDTVKAPEISGTGVISAALITLILFALFEKRVRR